MPASLTASFSGEQQSDTHRSKRTVLFLVSSLEVGGIETYLLRFLRYSRPKIVPIVLCKSGAGGKLEPEYESVGAEIVKLRLQPKALTGYLALYRLLSRRRIDAVCDFTGDFAGIVMLTARLVKVNRRITFYRGSRYQFAPSWLRLLFARFLGRLVKRFATDILSNSEAAFDEFQRYWRDHPDRFQVIRNAAPETRPLNRADMQSLGRRLSIPEGSFVVAHVGRATPAKNQDFVLSVAERMIREDQNVFFVLCGRGLVAKYESLLGRSSIKANVRVLEHCDEVLILLSFADAFLLPSLNEGMPNALVEAMSIGCPCVASSIPSIEEIFPPRYRRYLVDPKDTASAALLLAEIRDQVDDRYSRDLVAWSKMHFGRSATFDAFSARLLQ